jgi:hypothetical protein
VNRLYKQYLVLHVEIEIVLRRKAAACRMTLHQLDWVQRSDFVEMPPSATSEIETKGSHGPTLRSVIMSLTSDSLLCIYALESTYLFEC